MYLLFTLLFHGIIFFTMYSLLPCKSSLIIKKKWSFFFSLQTIHDGIYITKILMRFEEQYIYVYLFVEWVVSEFFFNFVNFVFGESIFMNIVQNVLGRWKEEGRINNDED